MKVMIAVDDSPCSQAALDFVVKLSWPAGTAISVVSSVSLPAGAYMATFAPATLQLDAWLTELTTFHEEVVARDQGKLRAAGLVATSKVLQGDARETLVEEATREHADLLVVGSHGRTGLDRLVMGSVASHVMSHAPCSVLVVKRPRATT